MTSERRVLVYHASTAWLKAYIPYERKDWIQSVKKIPGRWWATRDKCWMLPNKPESIDLLRQLFGKDLLLNSSDVRPPQLQPKLPPKIEKKQQLLSTEQQLAIVALEERLMLERKSYQTIKSYKHHLRRFFLYYSKMLPQDISEEQIKSVSKFNTSACKRQILF